MKLTHVKKKLSIKLKNSSVVAYERKNGKNSTINSGREKKLRRKKAYFSADEWNHFSQLLNLYKLGLEWGNIIV